MFTEEYMQGLMKNAKEIIPVRTEHYAKIMGLSYGRVTIRKQRTRWGSCSSKGNLNFNCLLILTPPEVMDYVIVHELCHLMEMNHSKAFWTKVEEIMPYYRENRKWLKEKGGELIRSLPVSKTASKSRRRRRTTSLTNWRVLQIPPKSGLRRGW